jgi:hypothetical protein
MSAGERPHAKVAQDCWRLIRALSSNDVGTPMRLEDQADIDAAAITLIELACDSAVEAEREDWVSPCRLYRPDHNSECLTCDEWADAHTPEALARGEQQALLLAMARDWMSAVVVRDAPDRVPHVIEQLIAEIAQLNAESGAPPDPPEELIGFIKDAPSDMAEQHDHYLYDAGSTDGIGHILHGASKSCPLCGAGPEHQQVRNHSLIWHDGDVYCTRCGAYVRRYDAG